MIKVQKNIFGKNSMKRFFFLIYVLTIFNTSISNSIENKIEFKVNNEIITSIDIIKELGFLTALNPKILELTKDQIFEISKNSLITYRIKEIEKIKIRRLNKRFLKTR